MPFQKDTFQCAVFQEVLCGLGTPENPFLIRTFTDLESIGTEEHPLSACYQLENHIDATPTQNASYNSGAGWNPRGDFTTPFTGQFFGNGKTISGIYINRSTDYVGLFGYINNSVIEKIKIIGQIIGGNHVGSLCGLAESTSFEECCSIGTINGTNNLGGLIGSTIGDTITNCYSESNSTGTDQVGGLIGNPSTTTLTNCYSIGSVSGTTNSGGLTGTPTGSTATSCYWNTQTSGQATSPLGIGKTTNEMKNPETFVDWNFSTIWESTEIGLAEISGLPVTIRGGSKVIETAGNITLQGQALIVSGGATIAGPIGAAILSGHPPTIKIGAVIQVPQGEIFLIGLPGHIPSELDMALYDLIPRQITQKNVSFINFKLKMPDDETFTILRTNALLNNEPIPINVIRNDNVENECRMTVDTNHLKNGWKKLDINIITENNSNQFRRYIKIL
ncbi:MAG: hypothetical protein WA125_06285 [Desulfosporosinus sp.]